MFKLLTARHALLPALALLMFGLSASVAKADQVFVTPVGATTSGGSVNAKVTFSQVGNVLTIKLENLQGQVPNFDVAQAISGLGFSIAGVGPAALTTQLGEHITVDADGTFKSAGVGSTFWGFPVNSGGNFKLTALGFASPGNQNPDELILGPPNGSNLYTGNGSINGNDPHNPFVKNSITFSLTFGTLPVDAQITNVTFFFGTGTESVPAGVPEPTSMLLLGTGVMGLAAGIRRRRRKSN
jgi:hypothetical protein